MRNEDQIRCKVDQSNNVWGKRSCFKTSIFDKSKSWTEIKDNAVDKHEIKVWRDKDVGENIVKLGVKKHYYIKEITASWKQAAQIWIFQTDLRLENLNGLNFWATIYCIFTLR